MGERRESVERLLTREESVDRVRSMLRGAIRPEVFWLHDGEIEARLTVDPDIAWEALSTPQEVNRG